MPLTNPTFSLSLGWTLSKANAGLVSTTQSDRYAAAPAFNTTVTNTCNIRTPFTIAAGANLNIDMRTFTDLVGTNTTAARAYTLFLRATGNNGAVLRLSPGTANAMTWFFGATTHNISLPVGTAGEAVLGLSVGDPGTVTASNFNLNLSNPGNATVTVQFASHQGT